MNNKLQSQIKDLKNDEVVNRFVNEIQRCDPLNFRPSFTERVTHALMLHSSDITLSVSLLSKMIAMSERQLQRKVLTSFGLTPKCLIKEVRLNKAAAIFSKTQLSITETALRVGFSSPCYFSYCFKKRYGVSPTRYKKSFELSD